MSEKKKDFYGKEVADAIRKACEELETEQENLDIEVIETGSTGIFGLRRKKAHIKAVVKRDVVEEILEKVANEPAVNKTEPLENTEEEVKAEESFPETPDVNWQQMEEELRAREEQIDRESPPSPQKTDEQKATLAQESIQGPEEITEISPENIDIIRMELTQILDLMGYPAEVTVEAEGTSIQCRIESDLEDVLIGKDGKTLDSMQYLLRKMIARKIPDRLRLSVDVGNYRERRKEELKIRAIELAVKVKEDGKTQVIPALSPSERRVVHMALQDDKEIRSRSVGDGLFKKILIYKPGKGKKGGNRKQSGGHGRRNNNHRQKK